MKKIIIVSIFLFNMVSCSNEPFNHTALFNGLPPLSPRDLKEDGFEIEYNDHFSLNKSFGDTIVSYYLEMEAGFFRDDGQRAEILRYSKVVGRTVYIKNLLDKPCSFLIFENEGKLKETRDFDLWVEYEVETLSGNKFLVICDSIGAEIILTEVGKE